MDDGGQTIEPASSSNLRRIASEDGDRLVIDDPGSPLTYGELDRLADQVASGLLDALGDDERPVGMVCQEVRAAAIAALGAMRAGKVLALLDSTAPLARTRLTLLDLDPGIVLSDCIGAANDIEDCRIVDPSHFGEAGRSPGPIGPSAVPSIHYTSGSTGVPKGVVLPASDRDAASRGLAVMGSVGGGRIPYFVGSGWPDRMIHVALAAEATLVPYDVIRLGIAGLPRWLTDNDIVALGTVPTLLRALVGALKEGEVLSSLRIVVANGESLHWSDVAALRPHLPPEVPLVNLFGLTESGGFAVKVITADTSIGSGPVPLGTVVPGVEVEIVDEEGTALPRGLDGEIVVTSSAVMLGYWRRPELTARVLSTLPDGRRRLRTGDGGRIDADGNLVHLGRLDFVVKIAGRRVELGEIESGLSTLPGVGAAAATTYEDRAGTLRLAAFVTPSTDEPPSPAALRAGLAQVLPAWMLPDRIVLTDDLPQLPNGKIDRRSLPDAAASGPSPFEDDQLVAALVDLWRETLDRADIGPDDDFFDAGGDSLRVARLFASIAARLGFDRPPTTLIGHPTPRLLASALTGGPDLVADVLSFNVGGRRPPLVVVHDGSGEIVFARKLAEELGDDQPVYAIRGTALDGVRLGASSLEELATGYVRLVTSDRRIDGTAQIGLCGFSLGGLIAFEMALQLESAGTPVGLLAVADSIWPEALKLVPGPPRATRLGPAIREHQWSAALRLSGEYVEFRRKQFRRRRSWRELRSVRPSDPTIPFANRADFSLAQYGRLGQRYRPHAKFSGSVLLLRAVGYDQIPDRGWAQHVAGDVKVVDVPCDHANLCREAAMPAVAAGLARYLAAPVT